MRKLFLDTTILAELSLKRTAIRPLIEAKLQGNESQLPGFAIREFKAGPLYYWAWLHNKLATTKSVAATLRAVHAMSRTPRRALTSTSIEALHDAMADAIGDTTLGELTARHGDTAPVDEIQADVLRLHIRQRIKSAWDRRKTHCTKFVVPLSCFHEANPVIENELLQLAPMKCTPVDECSLAAVLRAARAELEKLRDATESMPATEETKRRGKSLNKLIERPREPLQESECRALGDALFAFFAPHDATILTTNLKDHGPLAGSLGKKAEFP